jgi:hypothetical protein
MGEWKDTDNGGKDKWDEEPDPADSASFGAPGYYLPPGSPIGWPKYTRGYLPDAHTMILNGCPRCNGAVSLRHRDRARYCRACDRVFYPMSEDSVILPPAA